MSFPFPVLKTEEGVQPMLCFADERGGGQYCRRRLWQYFKQSEIAHGTWGKGDQVKSFVTLGAEYVPHDAAVDYFDSQRRDFALRFALRSFLGALFSGPCTITIGDRIYQAAELRIVCP